MIKSYWAGPYLQHILWPLAWQFIAHQGTWWQIAISFHAQKHHKYSLLMHRIKIKSPANFFYGMNKTFWGVDLSFFNQSYSGGITMTKKPTWYWQYYHSRCWTGTHKNSARSKQSGREREPVNPTALESCGPSWSLASTPWAMSLYFKFRAIYFWLLNEY